MLGILPFGRFLTFHYLEKMKMLLFHFFHLQMKFIEAEIRKKGNGGLRAQKEIFDASKLWLSEWLWNYILILWKLFSIRLLWRNKQTPLDPSSFCNGLVFPNKLALWIWGFSLIALSRSIYIWISLEGFQSVFQKLNILGHRCSLDIDEVHLVVEENLFYLVRAFIFGCGKCGWCIECKCTLGQIAGLKVRFHPRCWTCAKKLSTIEILWALSHEKPPIKW